MAGLKVIKTDIMFVETFKTDLIVVIGNAIRYCVWDYGSCNPIIFGFTTTYTIRTYRH